MRDDERDARDNDAINNAIETYIRSMQRNYETTFDDAFVTKLRDDVSSMMFDEICERIEYEYM